MAQDFSVHKHSVKHGRVKFRSRSDYGWCAAQGSDVDKRLAQLEGEAKGENADQSDSYLSDLQALAHSTRAKIQVGALSVC